MGSEMCIRDRVTLFSDISFEIKRGERVALIGNNGTGKTTILKIINNLIPADSGTVTLGSNVHIGYYDQEHQLLHMEKTIFEEISDAYPGLNNTKIRNVLAAFLFTNDDVFKRISDLSGGERGRVSLAKLMLSDANFLILDEPTTGLHFADVHKLIEILRRLSDGGNTVIVIEHNLDVIKTADYIIDMGPEGGDGGGTVIAQGTPEEVAEVPESYTGYYVKKYLEKDKENRQES